MRERERARRSSVRNGLPHFFRLKKKQCFGGAAGLGRSSATLSRLPTCAKQSFELEELCSLETPPSQLQRVKREFFLELPSSSLYLLLIGETVKGYF